MGPTCHVEDRNNTGSQRRLGPLQHLPAPGPHILCGQCLNTGSQHRLRHSGTCVHMAPTFYVDNV